MHPLIKKAQEILEARRPTLRCGMFNHMVEIHHGDGSHFTFHNATVKKQKVDGFEMLLVWTEHCGYHAFFCADLEGWAKFKHA